MASTEAAAARPAPDPAVLPSPGAEAPRVRSLRAAAQLLSARDPVVAALLGALGPPRLRPPQPSHFAALVRAIVYQQLAGPAAAAIHGRRVGEGTLVLDSSLSRLGDEEIVRRLSTVRGIGRWTAEMFLLFQLRRLDVWPTGDLGVRRGYGLAWGVPMPPARQLEALGDRFRPYRSIVAWYCWRACELYARQDGRALTG